MGHRDIKTTMRYAHVTREQMAMGVELLERERLRHNYGTMPEKGSFQEKNISEVIDDKSANLLA